MLKCTRAVEDANTMHTNELSGWRRFSLFMHLLMCHHCRRYVRQLKMLLGALGDMHGDASDEEVERVLKRLRESHDS